MKDSDSFKYPALGSGCIAMAFQLPQIQLRQRKGSTFENCYNFLKSFTFPLLYNQDLNVC